jgi:hypothetical protein
MESVPITNDTDEQKMKGMNTEIDTLENYNEVESDDDYMNDSDNDVVQKDDDKVAEKSPKKPKSSFDDEDDLDAPDEKTREVDEIIGSSAPVIQKTRSPEDLAIIAFRAAFREICGDSNDMYIERAVDVLKNTDNFINLNMTLYAKATLYFISYIYKKKTKFTTAELPNFVKVQMHDVPSDLIPRASADLLRYVKIYAASEAKINK